MTKETEQSVTLTPREIEEELNTPLPRGAGADAPQSVLQDAHVPLEYTEQTFNQLVAANTAMTGEISNLNSQIDSLNESYKARVDDLNKSVDDLRFSAKSAQEVMRDQRKAFEERKADVDTAKAEADFMRQHAESLQRKLDRSAGYIDRVIDEQQMHRDRDGAPVMPNDIGPDLASIPDAWRRPTDGRIPFMAPEAVIRPMEYPRKRY